MEQIAAGSESAVEVLLSEYGDHLCRTVRRRLGRNLRSKFDTVDFVQAVWASFFHDRGQLAQFEDSRQLVAFLTQVANNKVVDECRHRQTQKADVGRECSLTDEAGQSVDVPGRDPTPSQVAIGHEAWEQMLADVPAEHREILELRVRGDTQDEIAGRLGVNEKTVRRVLSKLRHRAEKSK